MQSPDLHSGEAKINEVFLPRIGVGYDSHRLVEGRALRLGGIDIPFERGLLGHSDGDALLHAIGDALCGAACLPDIGQLFPDNDAHWKDADSRELLRAIYARVVQNGLAIGNVDAVVVAERPKISPYVPQMRASIAEIMHTKVESVNVRGKTAEGLGALGANEGIAVHAVCLLVPIRAAVETHFDHQRKARKAVASTRDGAPHKQHGDNEFASTKLPGR